DTDTDTDTDAHSDANARSDSNTNTNTNTNTHTHTDADADAGSDSNTDTDADAHAHPHSSPDAGKRLPARAYAERDLRQRCDGVCRHLLSGCAGVRVPHGIARSHHPLRRGDQQLYRK
ncbi:hypothetical protein, partial [Sphingomonas sp. ATCC 31555]